jgi:hypothetical protein
MEYCSQGDNPIVKYKFGNGGYRFFKTKLSPIVVISKSQPIPNTDNYNKKGFRVQFERADTPGIVVTFNLLDYRIEDTPPGYPTSGISNSQNTRILKFQECGDTSFNPGEMYFFSNSLVIDSSAGCLVNGKDKCSIQINYDGNLIFQDQGDCPVSAEVQCGNCPPHNIECKANHYPGYCCIPCESTAQKIHNLANGIK